MSNATLENTYWKLLELGDQLARVTGNIPEPHLLLHPADKSASGSTGCNGFSGPYTLSGDSLSFGNVIATLRACTDPAMNQQERGFLKALGEIRAWKVTGDTLLLSGQAGPLARFAAIYLK
jgi:heat shock protein HslJ